MEKQFILRARQQLLNTDIMALQGYVRETIDRLRGDAIVNSPRFVGLTVTKTGAAQVTAAAGRLYSSTGPAFVREGSTVKDLLSMLPVVAKRKVAVVVWGIQEDTQIEQRKFRINAETNQVEPDDVAVRRQRTMQIDFLGGVESADPQLPLIDAAYLHIATITLSPTEVETVEMIDANRLDNLGAVATRINAAEDLLALFEGLFVTLRSDIAALWAAIAKIMPGKMLEELIFDVARLKELNQIEDANIAYDSDLFIDETESDTGNVDYDARIDGALLFDWDALSETALQLFNALDASVKLEAGFILPAYTPETRIKIEGFAGDVAMQNYTSQTTEMVKRTKTRTRKVLAPFPTGANLAAGIKVTSVWDPAYDAKKATYRIGDEVWNVKQVIPDDNTPDWTRLVLEEKYTEVKEKVVYWDRITSTVEVDGYTVAQTFLNAQAGYTLGPKVYFTAVGASGDVHCFLCEVTNGAPDLSRGIANVTVAAANLKRYPEATQFPFTPQYLEPGKRYAFVFISQGAHRLGLADKNRYAAGTLFYSTDNVWFQADSLQKDLLLDVVFCRFNESRVVTEFTAQSLSGGLSTIDMTYEQVEPEGTSLVFEYQPNGSGAWYPIAAGAEGTQLNTLPPLIRMRAVFTGSPDVMPGVGIAKSRTRCGRLKEEFKHISTSKTIPASDEIKVSFDLIGFDSDHHDATISLIVAGSPEAADSTSDEVIPAQGAMPAGIRRTSVFNLGATTTAFKIVLDGETDNPLIPFAVTNRFFNAL